MTDGHPEDAVPDEALAVEVAELAAIVGDVTAVDHDLEAPPPGMWSRIAAAIDARPDEGAEPRLVLVPTEEPVPGDEPAAAGPRGSRSPALRWAAAATVVVALVGAAWFLRGGGDDAVPLANATLEPLEALEPAAPPASATLVEVDGHLEVRLEGVDVATAEGFVEVWLLDDAAEQLVSLGPLRPDGTYLVPDGVRVEEFPVLDLSVEAVDGDPGHSGDSVLRGAFTV